MQFRNTRLEPASYTRTEPDVMRVLVALETGGSGMDVVTGIFGAILTLAAIGLVIALVAYMFPIIFSLGTILDKRIHDQ